MYRYRKLRGRIVETYGSQSKFAKEIELSENSVSKKLNGFSGFSQEDIETWSNKLNITQIEYGEYFFT